MKKIFVLSCALALTGCPQAIPAIAPSAVLVECVVVNALDGKNVDQIATACESDVPAVIQAIVGSKTPAVQKTAAYAEAKARAAK